MRVFSLASVFLGEENASLCGNDFAPGCLQQANLYTPWGGSGNGLALRRIINREAVVRIYEPRSAIVVYLSTARSVKRSMRVLGGGQ